MKEKTCIIALSFGDRNETKDYDHLNYSNWQLAKIASNKRLPVIAQWEIAKIMETSFKNHPIKKIEPTKGKYLDSYEVLEKAKDAMNELGFTEAIILCHQDHLFRVKMIAKKLGIEISRSFFLGLLALQISYDPYSTQWWTRKRFYFWLREIPVYVLLFIKRQI